MPRSRPTAPPNTPPDAHGRRSPLRPRFAGVDSDDVAGLRRAVVGRTARPGRGGDAGDDPTGAATDPAATFTPSWPALACLVLPAFALQRLLRRQPDWLGHPTVVVDVDRPTGRVLWANREASRLRIRPGMRYAAALSLTSDLRAGVVPPDELAGCLRGIAAALDRWSPRVEPHPVEVGVLWLDLGGMSRLIPSIEAWATGVREALLESGYHGSIAVGFTRFGVMAAARCRFGMTIFETPDDERRAVSAMPLERLAIDPALRDALERFGIVTVGQFARLPAAGLRQRFGEAAEQLHRLVTDGGQAAAAWVAEEELRETRDLEYRESNAEALAFWIKQTLDPLLARVEAVHARVTHVGISLKLDDGVRCPVSIKPAEPTNDVTILLDLIRLRLEGLPLTAGVVSFATQVWIARAEGTQLSLFAAEGRRDLEAANRALARVRAELGDGSVQRLTVRDAHLPEARSQLVPFERLVEARPSSIARPRLVRRLHERPTPLHGRARHEPDGWMVAGLEAGPVDASWGPFSVSGGWWAREVQRDYYIAETRRGDLLWLFHDRVRRAWFLHGAID